METKALALPQKEKSTFSEYFGTSKPGIIGLVVVATLTGIFFGNMGTLPDWTLIASTLFGIGLSTAGSCMLNNYHDRDIDKLMDRTSSRALAKGTVSETNVLIAGLIFVTISFVFMWEWVNPLASILTLAAAFGYVVLYGMIMKRRTPWANQVGGIAGALPPMIGYAAVTGYVDMSAFILFAIMVVWQQPHALSLALKYREQYAKANIPVIPVAKGIYMTKVRIAVNCVILAFVTILPYTMGMGGDLYLATAILLNAIYIYKSVKFLLSDKKWDMPLFFYSMIYLVVLFGALVVDFA